MKSYEQETKRISTRRVQCLTGKRIFMTTISMRCSLETSQRAEHFSGGVRVSGEVLVLPNSHTAPLSRLRARTLCRVTIHHLLLKIIGL